MVSHLNNGVECHKTRRPMKDYVKTCRVAKLFVRVAIDDYFFSNHSFLTVRFANLLANAAFIFSK